MGMDKMSVIELIKKRKSIRTYKNEILEDDTVTKLNLLISKINIRGPFKNEIRYELVLLDQEGIKNINSLINYGFIKGCPAFVAGIMDDNENYLVDFGYLMEDLILQTVELELDTCWLGGSLNTDAFKDRLKIKGRETLPAIFSLGLDAQRTRSYESVIRSSLKGNKRKPWSQLFFLGTPQQPLDLEERDPYREVLEMVRIAPSACNKQPWRVVKEINSSTYHFYLVRDQIYSKSLKLRKRSDLQKMDMGIAMYHFEQSALELGLKGNWISSEKGPQPKSRNFEYIISWTE